MLFFIVIFVVQYNYSKNCRVYTLITVFKTCAVVPTGQICTYAVADLGGVRGVQLHPPLAGGVHYFHALLVG